MADTPSKMEKENERPNESNNNSIINKFGRFVKTAPATRTTINIAELQKIEKELKTNEAVQITNIEEFAKMINATTTDLVAIRNKIYREYQRGNTNLKPLIRDRYLYLIRK